MSKLALLAIVMTIGIIAVVVSGQRPKPSVEGYFSRIGLPADFHRLSGQQLASAQSTQAPGSPDTWQYTYSLDHTPARSFQELAQTLKQAGYVVDTATTSAVHAQNGHIAIGAHNVHGQLMITAVEMK